MIHSATLMAHGMSSTYLALRLLQGNAVCSALGSCTLAISIYHCTMPPLATQVLARLHTGRQGLSGGYLHLLSNICRQHYTLGVLNEDLPGSLAALVCHAIPDLSSSARRHFCYGSHPRKVASHTSPCLTCWSTAPLSVTSTTNTSSPAAATGSNCPLTGMGHSRRACCPPCGLASRTAAAGITMWSL
jgi:hypothetical protein